MVMVLAAHVADTPAGSPVDTPMPVAPIVLCVMLVRTEFTQSVGLDDAAPAVLFGVTVMVVAVVVSEAQEPDLTTALYEVVVVKLEYTCEIVVFAMVVPAVAKLSREDSHEVTNPVLPESVNVPELLPVHTVAAVPMLPATVAGSTVIVAPVALAIGQPPF